VHKKKYKISPEVLKVAICAKVTKTKTTTKRKRRKRKKKEVVEGGGGGDRIECAR